MNKSLVLATLVASMALVACGKEQPAPPAATAPPTTTVMDHEFPALKLPVKECALGIATIADTAMSLAVRAVSVNKGVDPRETAMIAFGGAGPLHAIAVAREIFIPRVIIPKLPGTFSRSEEHTSELQSH